MGCCKIGYEMGMASVKGWLTHLRECVLTLNMRGTQGLSPLDSCLCFPDGSGQEGVGKERVFSFPHHLRRFLPLLDAVV